MRSMVKIIVLVFILTGSVFAQTHQINQCVYIWPDGYDAVGVKFWVYNLYKAETHWLNDESGPGVCWYDDYANDYDVIQWFAQISNFNGGVNPWQNGDTIICFGSWDSAYVTNPSGYGDNPNHCGFYWIYSDTVNGSVHPEHWDTDDTLRVIPKPIVSKTGPGGGANDTIWVRIPNPKETRRAEQTEYDVLGYWLFADTTDAAGTPDAYAAPTAMEIAFITVSGVYGDTTVFWMLESDGFGAWNHWTTYFAYKIVARPDTTIDNVGYSTYYFSQNSDAIDVYQNVVGIKENTQPRIQQIRLQALPNLFTDNTRIVFSITKPALVKLVVYNTSGQIIRTLVNDVKPAGDHHIEFDGTDTQGIELPAGIYFYQLQTTEQQLTGRLIKLR